MGIQPLQPLKHQSAAMSVEDYICKLPDSTSTLVKDEEREISMENGTVATGSVAPLTTSAATEAKNSTNTASLTTNYGLKTDGYMKRSAARVSLLSITKSTSPKITLIQSYSFTPLLVL